jgi:DNA invertase Pin-like site-specific DNA recombinase
VAQQLRSAQKAAQKPRSRADSLSMSPPPVRKRLPKSVHREIIAAYQAGSTTRQLAQVYGASKTSIQHILHAEGITLRRQPLTPDQAREAKRLYATGLSTYAIAKQFGVVQSTVWRALNSPQC